MERKESNLNTPAVNLELHNLLKVMDNTGFTFNDKIKTTKYQPRPIRYNCGEANSKTCANGKESFAWKYRGRRISFKFTKEDGGMP